jgi:hypothetical protein
MHAFAPSAPSDDSPICGRQHTKLVEDTTDVRTAVYSALLNESGNMVAAIADMDCFDSITPEFVARYGIAFCFTVPCLVTLALATSTRGLLFRGLVSQP